MNQDCVQCRREHSKASLIAKREKISRSGRQRYLAKKEMLSEYYKQRYRGGIFADESFRRKMPSNPEIFAQRRQKYNGANLDKIRAADKRYRQSNEGKAVARRSEHRRRALELNAHNYPWTKEQIEKRLRDFDNECAYCGRSDRPLNLDHFLSLDSGGANCLGNLVPCCRPCNSSKNNRDPKAWYESKSAYSKKRWNRILAVLGLSKVDHRQMPLF